MAATQRVHPLHITQAELARRWKISPRTLERWRWLKQGPRYLKLGGRVVYRLEDIEAFEAGQLRGGAFDHASTTDDDRGASDSATTTDDDLIVAMLEQRPR